MKWSRLGLGALGAWSLVYLACAAGETSRLKGDRESGSASAGGNSAFNPNGSGGGDEVCTSGMNDDYDQDGFARSAGDCNDCDTNVNPGAVEVPTDSGDADAKPADENCDGDIDEPAVLCDADIPITDSQGMAAAAALELCNQTTASGPEWGVLSANFVRANGTPTQPGLQAGIIDGFGSNVPPRQGGRMLALSSGHARAANHPNPCNDYSCAMTGPGTAPPGFPQDVPSCGGGTDINDDVALEVEMRAPTNATGYSFDFTFYSFEYPEWVCTTFNDQFIALVDPAPMGAINGNISFDSMTNPVSVNIAFFQVCAGCPLGTNELAGTGFDTWDDAGATGWLVTQAPVTGGDTLKIRFAIWDTGDQAWDSTVLVDNFQWIANAGTVTLGTEPVK